MRLSKKIRMFSRRLRCLLKRRRIRKHSVNSHRIGDVLDFAISERLISANQFVFYLLVNAARDVNLARIGNTFKTRSNIDAITVNVVCFDDNVAEIDANPIFDPMMLRQRCVASNHVLLDDDAAPHGFDRTVENRNEAVAGGLDEPSVVLGNAGLYKVALDPLDASVRSFFIEFALGGCSPRYRQRQSQPDGEASTRAGAHRSCRI